MVLQPSWSQCLASLHLQLPIWALRSWLPAVLALQLNPAETKDGSVGFPYINAEQKIKLWALIRNLCLGFILLLPARHFSFPASLSGTQFIHGCWTATFIYLLTHCGVSTSTVLIHFIRMYALWWDCWVLSSPLPASPALAPESLRAAQTGVFQNLTRSHDSFPWF